MSPCFLIKFYSYIIRHISKKVDVCGTSFSPLTPLAATSSHKHTTLDTVAIVTESQTESITPSNLQTIVLEAGTWCWNLNLFHVPTRLILVIFGLNSLSKEMQEVSNSKSCTICQTEISIFVLCPQ